MTILFNTHDQLNGLRRAYRTALYNHLTRRIPANERKTINVYFRARPIADLFGANYRDNNGEYKTRISQSQFDLDTYATVSAFLDGENLYFGIEPTD